MKKILFTTAAVMAGFFISANAGVISHKTDRETRKQIRKEKREERRELSMHSVNYITEDRFYNDFPHASNVTWTKGIFAEANFYDGEILKTAYYDKDNALVGTTTDVHYSTLPDKAKGNIAKKYSGYSVKKVILFDDNESNDTDMFLFSNSFKDEDTYFAELDNGAKQIIVKIAMDGNVAFFRKL